MPVTFEPKKRLEHLEEYLKFIHLNLPIEEARIQLLRCRIVGYGLVAEISEVAYNRAFVDQMFQIAYGNISEKAGRRIEDPYLDPCSSQYLILDELRSYLAREPSGRFMTFVRSEFKKAFVPTMWLMTYLCRSEKKYSWDDVKLQLQEIMQGLGVDVTWKECEEKLGRYIEKTKPIFES